MTDAAGRLVVLGRISGVFGLRGELKVESYTEPREGICGYSPWRLRRAGGEPSEREVEQGRRHGKGVVVKLRGVDDPDLAHALVGSEVLVERAQLPPTAEGEHYWDDLEGMEVVTVDGTLLGEVSHLFSTGANDVMVVRGDRERLVPFIADVVRDVDEENRRIRVDWDPEF